MTMIRVAQCVFGEWLEEKGHEFTRRKALNRASVSLEEAFWQGLKEIAMSRQTSVSDLIARIDIDRRHSNLSSAVRLFVLGHYQGRAA